MAIAGFTVSNAMSFDADATNDLLNFNGSGRNGFFVVYSDTLGFDYGTPVVNSQNQLGNGVHFDDNSGKLWTAGTVIPYGSIEFGDSTFTVTGASGAEAPFVMLFDTAGAIELINVYSSSGGDRALGLDVDTDGNAYVSGWVSDTLDMGDGFVYTAAGGTDAFMMVVDQTGTTLYGTGYGGANTERAGAITVDDLAMWPLPAPTKAASISATFRLTTSATAMPTLRFSATQRPTRHAKSYKTARCRFTRTPPPAPSICVSRTLCAAT